MCLGVAILTPSAHTVNAASTACLRRHVPARLMLMLARKLAPGKTLPTRSLHKCSRT